MSDVADYRILAPARSATQGSFFVAEPPARLGLAVDRVLLKVVPGISDDATFRRVARELRAFAAVSCPYLVELYDAGQDGDRFYYSMEHLPLGSLAMPARPLGRVEILRAVHHAALAAHALHEAGIAHRAIQPATVLLGEHGAKLADLGRAQALGPDLAVTSLAQLEAIEYLDPAALSGAAGSRAGDVWSLGATLHRSLTGQGLYGELPLHEPLVAVRQVLTTTPALAGGLTDDERGVIERCLAPDLATRWVTAGDLARALGALVPPDPDPAALRDEEQP